MKTQTLNTARWPRTANMSRWARLLGITDPTIRRYVRLGKLEATRKLNGQFTISKEAVMKCFGIE
jgi:excisionase family DNA binding protein